MDAHRFYDLKNDIQDELSARIRQVSDGANQETIKALIEQTTLDLAYSYGDIADEDIRKLNEDLINEFIYLGPLEPLLKDPTISEIMVNGSGFDKDGNMLPHKVWIERDGILEYCPDIVFENEEHVRRIMNRIVARQGRHIDESNPIEDATLTDGSRFNGTIYPVAPDGSTFNIRRFQQDRLGFQDLLRIGTFTEKQMIFLKACVIGRCSILVSGGTGSGKTTLLNVLGRFIPKPERIITIEDTCELQISHANLVRLEARKKNIEGEGEITLDDHLRSALRKRPDRIIVGECRGPEAYTMLEAMNTGHEGSMTTIHANSPVDALVRLATLVKSHSYANGLSEDTIKAKIASALDLVVQIQRLPDGTRKCVGIESVGDYIDGNIQHEPLWEFKREGMDEHGNVIGRHISTGVQPAKIRQKIQDAGIEYDLNWRIDDEVI